eukprot:gb/GECG01004853.1/.p1 GENE.gb/GECG01004853.1/~~gb/GECG01004853.1/.p1  ORF type:complete len:252 (+),score=29.99 gb/GECG01004853.1/:1-756(+)
MSAPTPQRRQEKDGGEGGAETPGKAHLRASNLLHSLAEKSTRVRGSEAHRVVDALDNRRLQEQLQEKQPQVHILGEILGGTGFSPGGVCCKWVVEAGNKHGENLWALSEGEPTGQTQTAEVESTDEMAVWMHPIDVHYTVGSVSHWPRMLLSVWELDSFGRLELSGYSTCHIPAYSGSFELECPVWRPVGDMRQELTAYFIGGVPHLKSTSVLYDDRSHRKMFTSVSGGTVHLRLEVILRNFSLYNVDSQE